MSLLLSLRLAGCASTPAPTTPIAVPSGPSRRPTPPAVARFEDGGAHLRAPWPHAPEVGVALAAWGAADRLEAAPVAEVELTPTGASWTRGGLVETWRAVPAGLEHTFRVDRVPPVSPLVLELAVEGADAVIEEGARSARFVSTVGGVDLGYTGLRAHDGRGHPLRAWMVPTRHGLRLVVDTTGATPPVLVDPVVTISDWSLESDVASTNLGSALAAGDVNGDGIADLVMGASGFDGPLWDQGAVSVVFGSAAGLSAVPDWTAYSRRSSSRFASALGSADVDGDGFDDVLVGAPGFDDGVPGEGAVMVYLGSATGPSASPDATLTLDVAGQLGTSVSSAGDVNGDGFEDVIAGGPNWSDGAVVQGTAVVFHGSAAGLGTAPAWTWASGVANGKLGSAVAGVGDLDHDGYDDVVVTAPYEGAGVLRLFRGGPSGLGAAPVWQVAAPSGIGYLGTTATGPCDVDGDGWGDVVVGAPNREAGQALAASVLVYRGSPVGPSTTPEAVTRPLPGRFGAALACAGDVDGDGADDVLVGAPEDSQLGHEAGSASLYLGSADGLHHDPVVVMGVQQNDGAFGVAVAGLDADGDGLSDLAMGGSTWDGGQSDEGRVELHLGRSFADGDGDGVPDPWDVCPGVDDPDQVDLDGDGAGDGCDAPELELVGVLAPGAPVTWVARGVLPGETVRFGAASGPPAVGPCFPNGLCLDLGAPAVDLGSAVADASGEARLATTVPAAVTLIAPWTAQALVVRGDASVASAALVLDGASIDRDGDGLTNDQETAAGTDPADPDSDQDGSGDAQELLAGTDPQVRDTDLDGVLDGADTCADAPDTDLDGDGVAEACDVCPGLADPGQADADGDGHGDACDVAFPPSVTDVRLAPASPFAGEQPRCRYTFHDADGDADASLVSWTLDGAAVGSGEVCPVAVAAGQRVVCRVVPRDGTLSGVPRTVGVTVQAAPTRGNLLLIVADDLGADDVGFYGTGAVYPETPRIDALAEEGLTFTRAYANPVCSPSRTAIQTGRYPVRDGITDALSPLGPVTLPLSATTLPEMLDQGTGSAYATAMLGKWHLGNIAADMWNQPNQQGYDWFGGMAAGFDVDSASDHRSQGYYDWEKTTNGVVARTSTYATVDTADDAVARLAVLPEPWLMVVAFAAPHAPLHWPPAGLYHGAAGANLDIQRYHAMIEALDTELGRILDAMTPAQRASTTIVFTGDNGPWDDVISPPLPSDRGKTTVYEGGIHVPLVVAGPWVDQPGSVTDALVQQTDLYATFAAMADIAAPVGGEDSISFLPVVRDPDLPSDRPYVYSDMFQPPGPPPYSTGKQTVTDGRWKLIRYLYGPDELYDLADADHEGADLLAAPLSPEAEAAYEQLQLDLASALQ